MYSDDLADAMWFALDRLHLLPDFINVGFGLDYKIIDYYRMISQIVGYDGDFDYDLTKPQGMRRKLLDSSVINALGWYPAFSLRHGLDLTYDYYLSTQPRA